MLTGKGMLRAGYGNKEKEYDELVMETKKLIPSPSFNKN